jgi:tripartite-type tricarboxylate transporter receptor subunit TctC
LSTIYVKEPSAIKSRHNAVQEETTLETGVFTAVMTATAWGSWPRRMSHALKPITSYQADCAVHGRGGVDTVARILGDELKGILGQQLVIKNMPGASGMRGAETAVRSDPDGYTLLLSTAGETAVNPHLFKNIKYNPERDLAPVSLIVKVPNVLVVNAAFRYPIAG